MSRYLPQELVEKIICELPFKSRLRFLTVSKEWNKLIPPTLNTPPKKTHFLLACSSVQYLYAVNIVKDEIFEECARVWSRVRNEPLLLTGYGNGLILFRTAQRTGLCNPLIHRVLILPGIDEESKLDKYAFAFGIVVDQGNDDIKVLLADVNMAIGIYRMSTGTYELLYQAPFLELFGCQVDLKGLSYWIGRKKGNDHNRLLLVSFDGHTESFGCVAMPFMRNILHYGEDFCHQFLFLSGESLVFIHGEPYVGDQKDYVITCNIWRMVDTEGKDWKLCWKVIVREVVRPLGFWDDDEFLWAGSKSSKLYCSNLKKESCSCIGTYCASRMCSYPNYVESLALL